jgi:hypothetical protein
MTIQYVHTFVFACTHCQLPVAITSVSGDLYAWKLHRRLLVEKAGRPGLPASLLPVTDRMA